MYVCDPVVVVKEILLGPLLERYDASRVVVVGMMSPNEEREMYPC